MTIRVSQYQNATIILDFIGARMIMEVVVTTTAVRRAMFQSNRHHQQANTQLFTGRMPFLSPNQQCQSNRERKYHIPRNQKNEIKLQNENTDTGTNTTAP